MKKILGCKKFKICGVLLCVIAVVTLFFVGSFNESNVVVKIKNNTGEDVNGLKVLYVDSDKNINLPKIPAKSAYEINLSNEKANKSEALFLNYKDGKENDKNVTLIGYIERGYSGNVDVCIDSKDQCGDLHMKVDSNIKVNI